MQKIVLAPTTVSFPRKPLSGVHQFWKSILKKIPQKKGTKDESSPTPNQILGKRHEYMFVFDSDLHRVQIEDIQMFQRIRYAYLRHVKVHTWKRVAETRVSWNSSAVTECGETG
ncbi:hypothetical protein CDAR_508661 [Caerostris darwini]|uniref:Uncharacterized protein n=1 Tax=Caerostris darwini TaxID=1538125 RepID=A0AAV4N0Y8_9ARAC|nr:hypothetical protein CDAR_508661 [Caerostris darwini]